MSEYSRSFIEKISPFTALSCTSGIDAAYADVVHKIFSFAYSSATMHVIIFVVLAIGAFSFSFLPYKTRPVSPSRSTAYFAKIESGDSLAYEAVVKRLKKCTVIIEIITVYNKIFLEILIFFFIILKNLI